MTTRHPFHVSFVDSYLFPYDYKLPWNNNNNDQEGTTASVVLSEVSACRFLNVSTVILIGDSGRIYHATVSLDENDKLRVEVLSSSSETLILTGFNDMDDDTTSNSATNDTHTVNNDKYVDAEGCEVFQEHSNAILISSETPPALTWFDRQTGRSINNNNNNNSTLPKFEIPNDYLAGMQENLGLEAVTQISNSRSTTATTIESSFLITTTEAALKQDPFGFHRILLWNAQQGGDTLLQIGHTTSQWENRGKSGGGATTSNNDNYMYISDFDYWPEQELLFVLERDYNGITNMIRLWTVDLIVPVTRTVQSILNWTGNAMELSSAGGSTTTTVSLPVDNYEAICLMPSSDKNVRHLLLVNDDNHNPKQIGTQFVMLRLEANSFDNDNSNEPSLSVAGYILIALLVGLLFKFTIWILYKQKQQQNKTTHYHSAHAIDDEINDSKNGEVL